MLRGLLSAGAMIGPLKAEVAARARHAAVVIAAAVVCLLFVIVGLLALALASIAALEPLVGLAVAAAITGGAAILIGLIVLLVASSTGAQRRPSRRAAAAASDATAQLQKSVATSPLTWLLGAALVGLIFGRRL